jgi:hypothetical protein
MGMQCTVTKKWEGPTMIGKKYKEGNNKFKRKNQKIHRVCLCMFFSEKVVHCAVLTRDVALILGLIGDELLQQMW